MKAIKNITDEELLAAAKKKQNSHGKNPTYLNGFLEGAEFMRQKSIKENISLREKILKLKDEIIKYRKECIKSLNLAKKLAIRIEQNKEQDEDT